jgi:hypothetical protein
MPARQFLKSMNMTNPILLHSREIQTLTGKTAKFARNLIIEVWQQKGKPKQRWITIPDFCQYFDVEEGAVVKRLNNSK